MPDRALEPKDFQQPQQPATAVDSQERRADPRVPCARHIDILPCQARAQWKFMDAEVVDCSKHGLSLLLSEPMEVGQQFLVKLKLPQGIKLLLYTVHNAAPRERSRYRIGARFSGFAAQEFDDDPQKVMDALLAGQ